MHERRYARHGGWRRYGSYPRSRFGFGGPTFGGFGRHGMYGGYRSHYKYGYDYNPIFGKDVSQTVNTHNRIKLSNAFKMTLKWMAILSIITLTFVSLE